MRIGDPDACRGITIKVCGSSPSPVLLQRLDVSQLLDRCRWQMLCGVDEQMRECRVSASASNAELGVGSVLEAVTTSGEGTSFTDSSLIAEPVTVAIWLSDADGRVGPSVTTNSRAPRSFGSRLRSSVAHVNDSLILPTR